MALRRQSSLKGPRSACPQLPGWLPGGLQLQSVHRQDRACASLQPRVPRACPSTLQAASLPCSSACVCFSAGWVGRGPGAGEELVLRLQTLEPRCGPTSDALWSPGLGRGLPCGAELCVRISQKHREIQCPLERYQLPWLALLPSGLGTALRCIHSSGLRLGPGRSSRCRHCSSETEPLAQGHTAAWQGCPSRGSWPRWS